MSDKNNKAQFMKIYELAAGAREAAAGKIYDLNNILPKITELAAEGFQVYRIKPKLPLDLKSTKKAKETQTALEKMGFVVGWSMQQFLPTKKENETDQELECMEMLIKWDQPPKRQVS